MQALGKGLFGQDRVLVVGHGDEDGLAQAFYQIAALLKDLYGFGHSALGPLAAGLPAVVHSGQGDLGALAGQDILHMGGAHVAHADDAKFDLFHKKDSFLAGDPAGHDANGA